MVLAFGCSKSSEEKASSDDEKVEKDSKKKKKSDDTDELTNEDLCKKIGKLAKKEKPDMSEEKLDKLLVKCGKKLDEGPSRKKCAATCVADNDTMEAFEKCDRACRDKAKAD